MTPSAQGGQPVRGTQGVRVGQIVRASEIRRATHAPQAGRAEQAGHARRIAAELGTPESPEQAAARKAESSRKHRARQSLQNLAAALGVTVLLVAVIVFIVPRPTSEELPDVDYVAAAAQAQPEFDESLIVPQLGDDWVANAAEVRTGADKVSSWYIGLLHVNGGRAEGFVGFQQGINANDTWAFTAAGGRTPTGTRTIDGTTWDEYDYTSLARDKAGNKGYTLVLNRGTTVYVVFGSGNVDRVREVAAAVTARLPA